MKKLYIIESFLYDFSIYYLEIIYFKDEWEESKVLRVPESIYFNFLLEFHIDLVMKYKAVDTSTKERIYQYSDLYLDDKPEHLQLELLYYCINKLKLV